VLTMLNTFACQVIGDRLCPAAKLSPIVKISQEKCIRVTLGANGFDYYGLSSQCSLKHFVDIYRVGCRIRFGTRLEDTM
jgi:hypothetical protein